MPLEIFLADPDSKYNEGIMLEEYNGILSLVYAQKSKEDDGKVYKRWCFPQDKDLQPREKAIPWKVRLGKREQAVKTLKYFLDQLVNTEDEGEGPPIPF